MVKANLKNTEGSLHLPLGTALFFIVMTGFAIWGFLRHWRFMVQTQLRLDQCVGTVAQDFQDKLNSILNSNQDIKRLRAIIAAIPPPQSVPFRTALGALVVKQNLVLAGWQLKQIQWTIKQGCGKSGDKALPLPIFQFVRELPDPIGPKPLTWPGEMPKEFHFEASHSPRIAAAQVEEGKLSDALETQTGKWTAVWSPPAQFGRTNTRTNIH